MTYAFLALVVVVLVLLATSLSGSKAGESRRRREPVRLVPLRRRRQPRRLSARAVTEQKPYAFARRITSPSGYLDDSRDGSETKLRSLGLPVLRTPADVADWLELRVGQLAWLVHFDLPGQAPTTERTAHYVFRWKAKRSGGHRLIESPKPLTRRAQVRILDEILRRVPTHPDAHGFVPGRSIVTNARPHVGRRVVLKLDLENFYASVRFNRVVALFRSLGYAREAAVWLARLCTSAAPSSLRFPDNQTDALRPYLGRHLPQGAPTSPALANLSAFSLDVRLAGLARSFHANYTRYADDLTFSGDRPFLLSLRTFVPLAQQVVRQERFGVNRRKRKVLRDNQRQQVTGVVVNEHPNVARADYDRLKAILHNCTKHGPASQNRDAHPDFAAHLRGRVAHVAQLNPRRGAKLLALYEQVDWRR